MKKILTLMFSLSVLMSCTCDVAYGQILYPKTVHTANKKLQRQSIPDIVIGWQRADISGLSIPSVFYQWQLHNGKLVPAPSLTFGLAKIRGAADVKMTISATGDTTRELRGVVYWGYAATIGVLGLFPAPDGSTNPTFTIGIIGGVNDIAFTAGIDCLSKNVTGDISPTLFIGSTVNFREFNFIRKSTTVRPRNVKPL